MFEPPFPYVPSPTLSALFIQRRVPIPPSRWEQLLPYLAPAQLRLSPTELSLGLALYFHTCTPSRFLPPKSATLLKEPRRPEGRERASSLPRKMKLWPGDQLNPTPTFTPVSFLQSICPSSNVLISPSFAIAKPP